MLHCIVKRTEKFIISSLVTKISTSHAQKIHLRKTPKLTGIKHPWTYLTNPVNVIRKVSKKHSCNTLRSIKKENKGSNTKSFSPVCALFSRGGVLKLTFTCNADSFLTKMYRNTRYTSTQDIGFIR